MQVFSVRIVVSGISGKIFIQVMILISSALFASGSVIDAESVVKRSY
jgi:hypothetical protein